MNKSLNADFAAIALAVGIRVEQERTARQLTKEGLAELSGLASRYLWRVEEGMQNITLKNLVAIANYFEEEAVVAPQYAAPSTASATAPAAPPHHSDRGLKKRYGS